MLYETLKLTLKWIEKGQTPKHKHHSNNWKKHYPGKNAKTNILSYEWVMSLMCYDSSMLTQTNKNNQNKNKTECMDELSG